MAEKEYIERKAAYPIASKVVDAITNGKYHAGVFAYDIMDWIDDIPAADVRPVVRAKWEDETGYIFNLFAQRVYCPVCKSYAYFYPITTKNYCPNCGTDMRKEGDSKDGNVLYNAKEMLRVVY